MTEQAKSSKKQKFDDTPSTVQAEAEQIDALEYDDAW